jgi:3-oxoadipate enol-lactonase
VTAVAVHHRIDGDEGAPALVLAHSLGATLQMWDPQIAELGRHFRVVRYDLRGHGRSPAPEGTCDMADLGADLIDLLDRSGIERAHLCGLSIGAMIVLWVAAHHPARVGRLVACCAASHFVPASSWAERAALVRAHGTSYIADAVLARWFTPEYVARHPARIAALRATFAATSRHGYAACCDALERMDLRPDLGAISAPTLLIAASRDPATPPERSFEIAGATADCRVEVVEGGAHLVNVEKPERVTQLILSHLKEHP